MLDRRSNRLKTWRHSHVNRLQIGRQRRVGLPGIVGTCGVVNSAPGLPFRPACAGVRGSSPPKMATRMPHHGQLEPDVTALDSAATNRGLTRSTNQRQLPTQIVAS